MTDQTYKLVPVEPTGKMTKAAMGALTPSLHRLDMVSINAAVRHAIAAAPEPECGACPGDGSVCTESCRLADESPDAIEPVCGWKFCDGDDPFWYSECGYQCEWISGGPMEWDFCPHCGKRVQLREEVDDD